jgi:hypothetical protein
MIVTLHSTTKIVELQVGTAWVPARIWEGETQSGIQVHAYITRIAVPPGQDSKAWARREGSPQRPCMAVKTNANHERTSGNDDRLRIR